MIFLYGYCTADALYRFYAYCTANELYRLYGVVRCCCVLFSAACCGRLLVNRSDAVVFFNGKTAVCDLRDVLFN